MTHVITVPPSLDDQSFEQVLEQVAPLPPDEKLLVDARYARCRSAVRTVTAGAVCSAGEPSVDPRKLENTTIVVISSTNSQL